MINDFIDFNMDHICVLFFLTAKSSDGVLWNSSRHGIGNMYSHILSTGDI